MRDKLVFGFLYIFLIILFTTFVSSIPAKPFPYNLTNPDGTIIEVVDKGDEYLAWTETLEGYSIKKDPGGWITYAITDPKNSNEITYSQYKINKREIKNGLLKKPAKLKKHLHPKQTSNLLMEESFKKDTTIYTIGNKKLVDPIVLLIQFPDIEADNNHNKDYYYNLIFNPSNKNSLTSHYKEISYGNHIITGEISPLWYNASKNMAYYGSNGEQNIDDLINEAIDLANKNTDIDFSLYDEDGNGIVDNLIVIHSGPDDAGDGFGNGDAIWSHRGSINPKEVDGVYIISYLTVSEESSMGILAHEYGHSIGLPDLYDTSHNDTGDSYGVGYWSLMGDGGWLNPPAHLSAWEKVYKGWIVPTKISNYGTYSILNNKNQGFKYPKIYKIFINEYEYFLIENSQENNFPYAIDGDGILVWHIDESVKNQEGSWPDGNCSGTRWHCNTVNANENHKMVDLEEADGDDDLDKENNEGDYKDPWYKDCLIFGLWCQPYEFTEDSYPNSNDYNNYKTGIKIIIDTDSAEVMNITITPNSTANVQTGIITIYNDGNEILNVKDISSPEDWISVTLNSFSISPGLSKGVIVTVNSVGKSSGVYKGNLYIYSDDLDEDIVAVEITMIIRSSTLTDLFSTGFTSESFNFTEPSNKTISIIIPKDAKLINASLVVKEV